MRKLLLSLVMMALLPAMAFAEHVEPARAQKAAKTFLNTNGVNASKLIDLSTEAGFTNLYIFNAEKGFVVMAADNSVQPILGYSLTGHFVTKDMPENLRYWLQGYNDEIQYAIDKAVEPTAETAHQWKDLVDGNGKAAKATVVVDALIQSTWDQDPGYNDLCPYDSNAGELTVTGCVATAMAQIMRFWEYPSQGESSHSYTPSTHPEYGTQSVNYANATYDWTAMPLHSSSDEIAKLMYHCGVSVNMMYGTGDEGGSGAYSSDIPNALTTYFRYKSGASFKQKAYYSSNNWLTLIKTELNAGRPVQYNGSGDGGGHAFVCDGYDDSNYFHFNWGWSGHNDGFYSLSNLVPGSGGSGGGSYSFTNNQTAVIGIQPKDCTTSTPTNFNVTKDGRNAILTWTSASNAVSYSIYRDGLLIANTTSTTYTDSDLSYGTYAYYVKSRDTNGAASSATATLTIAIEPVASNLTLTRNGNGGVLNWTEPEWCMPKTDNEVLTYGDDNIAYIFGVDDGSRNYFIGHRYPTSMLANNKVVYKVSFYAVSTGDFTLFVYTSDAGASYPSSPSIWEQTFNVTASGWADIELTTPLQIDETKDLWVFIYDPDGKYCPFAICEYEGSDGNYLSYDPYNPTNAMGNMTGYAFLLHTCITDGAFFYNLYDGNTALASNLSGTSYTLSSIANNTAHQYTLKTNYNNGVTESSNMAGLTLGTASLGSLTMTANDKMVVAEGATLTVSGTLSDETADNLILEVGAQLIHHTDGVKATKQQHIEAYTETGGWYTIATPFISCDPAGTLATNDYDLYYYDEDGDSEGKEWINYKAGNYNLTAGQGYLYAHKPGLTLSTTGTLNNGDYSKTVNLGYANSETSLKGFNLLGNPTAHEVTFSKSNNVSDGYYYLDNSENWIYENSNTVPAGRGFLVKANATGQTVTVNPQSKRGDIVETRHGTSLLIDVDGEKAYVKLTDGVSMPLLSFRDKTQSVSLTRDGKPYVMLVRDDADAIDLNYLPQRAGQHQLSVTLTSSETLSSQLSALSFNYLHLIDNLTGADIDLLETPTYTFDARVTDYASRFRLLFAPSDDNSDDSFAYYNNGQIIITGAETCHGASLQIFDALGRTVLTQELPTANCQLSTANFSPGVYVLQLVNGDSVKTQKIVVK